jgi:molybdate-binding protein
LDDIEADANVDVLRNHNKLQDAVMIAFCRREQGFLVAAGNPLKLGSIEDVRKKRARIAVRPKGAGGQLLLLALLHRADIALEQLASIAPVCPTGPDIAQAIRAGRADTGIATRGVANAAGLDFVPIVWEPFDLVMRQRDYFRPPLQSLQKFFNSPDFTTRGRELGGYDLSAAGTVRFIN